MILLRKGNKTEPGSFERIVEYIARERGLRIEYRAPVLSGGRSAVFTRDYQMVDDADYVMAFFHADRVMEGGTGHVVEAAMNREKTVYAWSITKEGRIERVGELEPFIAGPETAW